MEHVWFRGNYASWADARAASLGYDAPAILEKVRHSTLKVISGEAACERDSVTFQEVEYSLPLLVCLLYIITRSNNTLSVLDFGGSLGSSYWQNRKFVGHIPTLRWSIVEQPHFVDVGRAEVANDVLHFYASIGDCLRHEQPQIALLSGVLQALEYPYETLKTILDARLNFVVLDRTQFFIADLRDRICVEYVHPDVYDASYPSWFFSLRNFRRFVDRSEYRILHEFNSWEHWNVDGDEAQNKCFLLQRRDYQEAGRHVDTGANVQRAVK